jgi:hypothetical protein
MREYGGDGEAARAFYVHEKWSRSGHECLAMELDTEWRFAELIFYLQFVFAGLGLRRWVEKINGENLKDPESALWGWLWYRYDGVNGRVLELRMKILLARQTLLGNMQLTILAVEKLQLDMELDCSLVEMKELSRDAVDVENV